MGRVIVPGSILSLALSATWIGTLSAKGFAENLPLTSEMGAFLRAVFFPEVLGAALLWAAMLYFWFNFDQSSWLKRSFWFLVLASVLPFLWALYFFFVYRKQLELYRRSAQMSMSVTRMLV